MGWIIRFIKVALFVAALALVPHERVLAQVAPPAAGTRAEFELQRMIEVVQEARDYIQRRRDLLGGLPVDVQPLVSKAQQLLEQLRLAIQQRDLVRARQLFQQAVGVFDEIRVRLNDAMDAQNAAANSPEQLAAKLAEAVRRLRSRLGELQMIVGPSPAPSIATELARIDSLIRALETPPAGATPTALRTQVLSARSALLALELAVTEQVATP
jgi:hypothetical protein